MNYETFKATAAALENECRITGARRDAIAETLAARLGIPARNAIGLTADAIKSDSGYRAAKAEADSAFNALRWFNGQHAKQFTKEICADIAARRAAKLQAAQ